MRIDKIKDLLDIYKNSDLSFDEKLKILRKLSKVKLSKKESMTLEKEILSMDDGFAVAFTASSSWANFRKHEERVIELKDAPVSNYFVSTYGNNCDIERHRKIILESKDAKTNFEFLTQYNGKKSDIEEHGHVIAESKNPLYNYLFSFIFQDTVNISENEKAVIENAQPIDSIKYIQDIETADIKSHREKILKSNSLEANVKFPLLVDSTEEEARDHYNRAFEIMLSDKKDETLPFMNLMVELKEKIDDGFYREKIIIPNQIQYKKTK